MKKPSKSVNQSRYTRLDVKDIYPGFYRARVELTRDPKKLGRVKIRIPHLHGFLPDEGGNPERYYHTSELPWAMPGDFSCAGYDYGQHMVPHVGTFVWVAFEAGDPDRPIYFGGIPYQESDESKKYGHIDDVPDKINPDHPDFMNHAMAPYYAGEDGSCTKEVYELDESNRETTEDITRQVLYKSVKGHVIVADDTDEKETFTIGDRLGQIIKFISPVTLNGNEKNDERRVLRTSFNEDTLHSDDPEVRESKAMILIKDIDNQIIRMVAEDGKDKIEVMSRDPELERNSGAVLSSEEDDVRFEVVAEDGEDRVVFVGYNKGNISEIFIVKGGSVETHLQLTADDGMLVETVKSIKLVANKDVEVETQQKFIVNAKAGIEMETEGDFVVTSNGSSVIQTQGLNTLQGDTGVTLQSPTTNITANGETWHEVGPECECSDCGHNHHQLLTAIGSSADSSVAEPEYVPEGMNQQWEDDRDELYVKFGDGTGTQGGAGLEGWDTEGGGGGGSGEEGEDPPSEEELEELVSECQNAPRGGLRKSDVYLSNQSWRSEPHRGVDYAGARGTGLTSPVNGVVVFSGSGSSYGNYVIIKEDGASRWHLFAHMASQCMAPINTKVSAGTVIGLLSNTGNVVSSSGKCGCHVHYEVRTQAGYVKGGGHTNPGQWEGKLSS